MLNCLIVDDDPMNLKIIESFVDQTDFLKKVGTCSDAIAASNLLKNEKVDLLFLDVEMPQMSGLELIESLQEKPLVVLITSKEKYAVDAFDLEVTDYVVKPVTYPRFLKAANRALEQFKKPDDSIEAKDPSSLFVKVDSRFVNIEFKDIKLVEAREDYVTIHTDQKRYTIYSTMKKLEKKLPENFMRVHRSYIVNLTRVEAIEDNLLVIEKHLIPVGGTYRERLMTRLNML